MVKAVSAKPRNCTAVSKIDPLRAPVCRKGMLVGDVSVNWKALCQQLSLKSGEKTEAAVKKDASDKNTQGQEVTEENVKTHVLPVTQKSKSSKKREGRKRESKDVEAIIENDDCVTHGGRRQRHRKGTSLDQMQGTRKVVGDVIKDAGKYDETAAEGIRENCLDVAECKPHRKGKGKHRKESESGFAAQVIGGLGGESVTLDRQGMSSWKRDAEKPTEEVRQPKKGRTGETKSKNTVQRAKKSEDVVKEVIDAGKAPKEMTHAGKAPEEVTCAGKSPKEVTHAGKAPKEVTHPGKAPMDVTVAGEVSKEVTHAGKAPKDVTHAGKAPKEVTVAGKAPKDMTVAGEVPKEVTVAGKIPKEVTHAGKAPKEVTVAGKAPKDVTVAGKVPKEVTVAGKVPKEVTVAGKAPKEVTIAGKVPKEVTDAGKTLKVRTLIDAPKRLVEETEDVPDKKKKRSKDVDANLKLLQDSGDVLCKKRDTAVLRKRPADFWFDDVDLGDMAEAKRPRASMLISGQDTSVGRYVALDCEMVGTGPEGCQSMLARCSVVNHHGNVVYDSFVAPMDTITDYRTRYSGVRQEDLKDAPTFKTVQKKISDLLKGKILIGHGLKHDLKALLLSHPKKDMRDTISYKPFRAVSQGKTPPLKKLAKELLGVDIQEGEHSSVEDSQAAMRLYQKHKAEWEEYLKRREKFRSGKLLAFKPGAQKPAAVSRTSSVRTKPSEKCQPFNVMLQCN